MPLAPTLHPAYLSPTLHHPSHSPPSLPLSTIRPTSLPPSSPSHQVEHTIQWGVGLLGIHLARVPKMTLTCLTTHSPPLFPSSRQVEHKIQSGAGPLDIHLARVPKMIPLLRSLWCPSALLVSFKLETDSSILLSKARSALQKNQVHAVVANELLTRGSKVVLVTEEGEEVIERGEGGVEGKGAVGDVEEPLVKLLAAMHHTHCQRDR
ncbi:unnamed protein product [Closterium sp. NIES-65]|nr:unnamed protein product [Closterium sp. NIES-65]